MKGRWGGFFSALQKEKNLQNGGVWSKSVKTQIIENLNCIKA